MTNQLTLYLENNKSQMRKGTLEFVVLLIISRGTVYALDILKKLKDVDMIVVEGTLYPLLSRLKREEVVTYSWKESLSGPPRKYYSLTTKGKKLLCELTEYWKKINASITNLTS